MSELVCSPSRQRKAGERRATAGADRRDCEGAILRLPGLEQLRSDRLCRACE
jgi:hypothetical protein